MNEASKEKRKETLKERGRQFAEQIIAQYGNLEAIDSYALITIPITDEDREKSYLVPAIIVEAACCLSSLCVLLKPFVYFVLNSLCYSGS